MSTDPRIYVACLAAYNNGRLHGAWIDANQSADDIAAEVQTMLAASPEPGAEEWAIHDYEGFGELRLSEWESFERVASIAAGIAEHGPGLRGLALLRPRQHVRVRGRISRRVGLAARIRRGLRGVDEHVRRRREGGIAVRRRGHRHADARPRHRAIHGR